MCKELKPIDLGIAGDGFILHNAPIPVLVEVAIANGEGILSDKGALCVSTGKYTGRSPDDKFIVDTPAVHDKINWGKINVPISVEKFNNIKSKMLAYLQNRELYVFDGLAGQNRMYTKKFRIVNELASQNLFIHQLLVRPNESELEDYKPDYVIYAAPGFKCIPEVDGVNSEAAIIINYETKEVLKGINFEFEKGKIYALLGRNGAGKTTLFNCINEDIPIDKGEFYLESNSIKKIEPEDIGYVLSTPNVPEFLTGREFLKFFLEINNEILKNNKSIDEYFDLVKIEIGDRDKLLKDYSHGMKNKMQMLVNIISNPNILLLDEPLTSFDVVVAEEMKELLKSIKKDHIVIFSTHILELALDLCDEIVILNKGTLEQIDKKDLDNKELKTKSNIVKACRWYMRGLKKELCVDKVKLEIELKK